MARKSRHRRTGITDAEQLQEWPEQVLGRKYLDMLEPYLDKLRAEDQAHGNQKLYLDDLFLTYLLAFFNPLVNSLRTIEDFSQTKQVQPFLTIPKIPRSTHQDFLRVVDPERLKPILDALRTQLELKQGPLLGGERGVSELLKKTIAVDGTFLPALATVAWAVCNKNNHGSKKYRGRVDVQLDVSTGIPEVIVIPLPGESEAESAIPHIKEDRIYIYDRGYSSYELINAHYKQVSSIAGKQPEIKAHFVIRYKKAGGNSPELKEVTERELTTEDRQAGVISDKVGVIIPSHQRHQLLNTPLREIILPYVDQGIEKQLRLLTNLLDVPASTIALL
jgi:hypothetical protein